MNELVDKRIAIGLKEVGFDRGVNHFYEQTKDIPRSRKIRKENYNYFFNGLYSAPTINEAIDWLYEKHGVYVTAYPSILENEDESLDIVWGYMTYEVNQATKEINCIDETPEPTRAFILNLEVVHYPTRTEAQTAGIDAAIQYIKNLKNGTS